MNVRPAVFAVALLAVLPALLAARYGEYGLPACPSQCTFMSMLHA